MVKPFNFGAPIPSKVQTRLTKLGQMVLKALDECSKSFYLDMKKVVQEKLMLLRTCQYLIFIWYNNIAIAKNMGTGTE